MAIKVKERKTKPTPLWSMVERPQLLKLVRAYYSGALTKSDSTPYTYQDKSIPMPHLISQGKPLIMDITYQNMDDVIQCLRNESVMVGGMTVQGWYEYVIRIVLKLEKAWIPKNELMPKVKEEHYQDSFEALGQAFKLCILNKK